VDRFQERMSLPNHIKEAIEHYIPHMGQWLSVERALEMAELIIDTKPDVVVEIGCFRGQSLVAQAFALRDNHHGCIFGIDPWRTESAVEGSDDPANTEWWQNAIDLNLIHQECMRSIWDHRLDDWAIIIRAPSEVAYRLFPENSIDILYVDGNHSQVASCRDVQHYGPLVKQGGIIQADDTNWPSTKRMVEMLDSIGERIRDNDNYKWWRKA
jgi:hypothetical protein